MEEKKDYRDELFYQPKNGYDRLSSEEAGKVESKATARATRPI